MLFAFVGTFLASVSTSLIVWLAGQYHLCTVLR